MPIKFKIKRYDYDRLYNELSYEDYGNSDKFIDIPGMALLESDEELKEGKGLKILTPNKFLTRLPISLAQIKAVNNSYKLKNEIRQILYLLYQQNKITEKFTTI